MQATLCENLQVDIDSGKFLSSADIVAIIAVRQLPPIYTNIIHIIILYEQGNKSLSFSEFKRKQHHSLMSQCIAIYMYYTHLNCPSVP